MDDWSDSLSRPGRGGPAPARGGDADPWSGRRREDPREARRPGGRREALEQRLDRWVSTGRQLVDGVAGARPGSRPPLRGAAGRRGGGMPRLDGLGRWVEDRLEWLLEDEDDWREPWQEPPAAVPRPSLGRRDDPANGGRGGTRRPLEAISRRTTGARRSAARGGSGEVPATDRKPADGRVAEGPEPDGRAADGWPDDASFQVSRWQRPVRPGPDPLAAPEPPAARRGDGPGPLRPLPRSSRRRD